MNTLTRTAASLILGLGALQASASIVLPELMYYKFNEGVGATSTTNQATTPAGTTTSLLTGLSLQQAGIGGTTALSGSSSNPRYVNTGWTSTLGSGSWSMAFWTGANANTSLLSYFFGDSVGFRGFTEGVAGTTGFILRGPGVTDTLITGMSTTADNHLAFVYDATLDTIQGYLNGVLNVTVAQPGSFTFGSDFSIGGRGPSVGNSGLQAGTWMDEFQLYSRALDASGVVDAMNANFIGVNAVPEPGALSLLALGMVGLWASRRKSSGTVAR